MSNEMPFPRTVKVMMWAFGPGGADSRAVTVFMYLSLFAAGLIVAFSDVLWLTYVTLAFFAALMIWMLVVAVAYLKLPR